MDLLPYAKVDKQWISSGQVVDIVEKLWIKRKKTVDNQEYR